MASDAAYADNRDPKAKPLPALGADIAQTTLSGISAGAYMAGQFQFAHARLVTGVVIIAGGPYGCARSLFSGAMPEPGAALLNLSKAINGCMLNGMRFFGEPDVRRLAADARERAAGGLIDPIDAVLSDRVFLYSGGNDRTVVPAIVRSAADFYRELGLGEEQVRLIEQERAGHAIITLNAGNPCDTSRAPFINDCDYDQAGAALAHVLGAVSERAAPPPKADPARLIRFDQAMFSDGLDRRHGLEDYGFAYVPMACEAEQCRVHVTFHGCGQHAAKVGDEFARTNGLNRWAEALGIVVLYPQVASSGINRQACWDWWGYTGRGYLLRDAPQIVAVRAMLDRLASTRR